jgi:hypothetical protein
MPIWVRGSELPDKIRRQVLDAYVYRWTSDSPHRAAVYGYCPHCRTRGGRPRELHTTDPAPRCLDRHPIMPFQTDEEWLRAREFAVTKKGTLHSRIKFCQPYYGDIDK